MNIQLVNFSGYPMYFTKKDSNIVQDVKSNMITGDSIITVAVTEPTASGTIVFFNREEHTVIDVLEERPCKGNHSVGGDIVFQRLKTSYTALSPIV